ncbi:MAG TPA: methyltransferase domain-containing protein [Myxococcota bacterium]|nr:methyltransferase domain-containing protein [Myxococcota bacterium]
MDPLAKVRREYAEKIRAIAGLHSGALARAFAAVAREAFVGPGPWQILRLPDVTRYETTPDADARRLYDNVLVALDADRNLNNGEPATLARWLDALELAPGDRFLHIGCGVGYYTAIAAECVGPGGAAVGVELDAALADRAQRNLARWPAARVIAGDGRSLDLGAFDAILVNAGATELPAGWLDALAPNGRLLVPLTVELAIAGVGAGHMLRAVRRTRGYVAQFVSPVGIFHCAGARTRGGSDRLRRAYTHSDPREVASLRRDQHRADAQCWLHTDGFCLSRLAADEC